MPEPALDAGFLFKDLRAAITCRVHDATPSFVTSVARESCTVNCLVAIGVFTVFLVAGIFTNQTSLYRECLSGDY